MRFVTCTPASILFYTCDPVCVDGDVDEGTRAVGGDTGRKRTAPTRPANDNETHPHQVETPPRTTRSGRPRHFVPDLPQQ